jgi:hypothetical protein
MDVRQSKLKIRKISGLDSDQELLNVRASDIKSMVEIGVKD